MIGLMKGMVTTFKHLMWPAVTERYPDVMRQLPERSRMSFDLPLDDSGVPLCKSCLLCAKSCPDNAIVIDAEKNPDGPGRVLKRFAIDLGLCMYCGICVESCVSAGIKHTTEFENVSADRDDMMFVLYERASNEGEVSA